MTIPRILLGETYLHARSGQLVEVLDHELRPKKRRPRDASARTGRYVVRPHGFPPGKPFAADEADLVAPPSPTPRRV